MHAEPGFDCILQAVGQSLKHYTGCMLTCGHVHGLPWLHSSTAHLVQGAALEACCDVRLWQVVLVDALALGTPAILGHALI